MGMMGMFKWLRKDSVQRERNGCNVTPKLYGLNNESYRNALQAFVNRRRSADDNATESDKNAPKLKNYVDVTAKNNNNKRENKWRRTVPGIPHLKASEIFEIGWVPGTEDKYLELIFAEWQNTRICLKRYTHPECREAVRADLEVLSEIRHPNVLLLMATTQTDDHGLVSIFEAVDCTLYNYIHEQGERISIQGVAKCGTKLCDALRYSHMRGYVHGAISSHCVYLASNGVVKLGGWELAVHSDNPKPERDYEDRLRAEIFRWQAPELFHGREPRKESDVYGLSLLIWEMCTTRVPWSGHNRADVEMQYVQWKRSVVIDLYEFPPELYGLLEAGLQLDMIKRTQDMNRMRRFLQRLEMQYEDKEPVFIECSNNNNESPNSYIGKLSPTNATKNTGATRPSKTTSAKQLTYIVQNTDTPKRYTYKKDGRPRITERLNLLDFDHANSPKEKKRANVRKDSKKINSNTEDWAPRRQEDGNTINRQEPSWSSGYKASEELNEKDSVGATSDEEPYADARMKLSQLKKILANRREHFFYGSDSPASDVCTSPRTKNRIFTQARSKDYEPHKPASHKTCLEPKYNKSPGEYDATYLKTSSRQNHKTTYSENVHGIKGAIAHRKVLHSDPKSFFESSLWRKEKLICISKMSKSDEQSESTFPSEKYTDNSDNNPAATSTKNEITITESPRKDATYTVRYQTQDESTRKEITEEPKTEITDTFTAESQSLQVLKDALDRATKLVRPETPLTDDSRPTSPFKTYEDIEISTEDEQPARRLLFEDMYNLHCMNSDEIRSIERSTEDIHFLSEDYALEDHIISRGTTNIGNTGTSTSCEPVSNLNSSFTNYTKSYVCDSIAELSEPMMSSTNKCETKDYFAEGSNLWTESGATDIEKMDLKPGIVELENEEDWEPTETSRMPNFWLKWLEDNVRHKNCTSCSQSALIRRRSLPARLCQYKPINTSALGKLPIRKADVPDTNLEDLYIDDEFAGDELDINMVLMQEDSLIDEHFLTEMISKLTVHELE